jgi:predicted Holliday junction resolvase-like endonuclease
MKSVLIFFVLLVLVACHPPHFAEDRGRRESRRKEFQKQMSDCLLKSEISDELKKQLQDNKDDDLRKILHLFITKLDSNDREIIRKCRRELFGKMREKLIGGHFRPNLTQFERPTHGGQGNKNLR